MKVQSKVWLILVVAVVGVVTLACSCNSLTSMLNSNSEPMAGLVGTWRDRAEGTNHTITWDGTSYHVTNSVNDDGSINDITSENWNGSVFSYDYYVRSSGVTVTINCESVSGNNMNLSWSSTNGNSGTDVFVRQ